MKHYAGLDISVKETAICIVDETGEICRELKVPSHPEDLAEVLKHPAWRLERIGLEAGPLSQWLFSGLVEAGLSAICIETRHAKAFLKAQVNKTDRNDARGIAQMMRVNLFRRSRHLARLHQHHRCSNSFPKFACRRTGIGIDPGAQSIGREPSHRPDLAMR